MTAGRRFSSFYLLVLAPLLAPAAFLYFIGICLDRLLRRWRGQKFPIPVISIGNLTLGGTAKTPFVIKTVKDLQHLSVKPAILSRGYRGLFRTSPPKAYGLGSGAKMDIPEADEPALYLSKLAEVPVGVGADRVALAKELLKEAKPDAFVLDDGFQHWPIQRDLDVVCVDATDPWGGGHLLPWGRLREPVRSVKRAHWVVLTRSEMVSREALEHIRKAYEKWVGEGHVLIAESLYRLADWTGAAVDLGRLLGKHALALSAIGNPVAFEDVVRKYGATVKPLRYLDHHDYSEKDLKIIEARSRQEFALVVTTEKDLIKLKRTSWGKLLYVPVPLLVLQMEVILRPEDEEKWQSALKSLFTDTIPFRPSKAGEQFLKADKREGR
ncbi:MAG: tetraacyldisaccharide 4'-kinase [Elusimicrobia bacterium]|nr:tetraacyldisaccharide 4'-kinase [Candidatus Obscuribacterium magneticum]